MVLSYFIKSKLRTKGSFGSTTYPANIYLLKVNSRNIGTMSGSGVFNVNFEPISSIF